MIFDASAIYKLVHAGKAKALADGTTLDLAAYELGNAVWKAVASKSIDQSQGLKLINFLEEILGKMETVSAAAHLDEVLDLAVKIRLTFYDAAYLHASIKRNKPLVTEDNVLYNAAKQFTTVRKAEELT